MATIELNPNILTPALTEREIEFAIHCFSKEFNGDERKTSHRVTEMSKAEWEAAREILRELTEERKLQVSVDH